MDETLKTPPTAAEPARALDILAGTTVGRFSIDQRLGAGGMGQVYGAEDTTLKRRVAIKRMAPQANSTDADRKRLLKEAQRASALNHPNVGAMYDVVEHAGELWLVMEYVEGETLRQRLTRPISTEEFFTIAFQCCEGLQAAHEKGIIHGDIKPENIMLAPGNRVKILDFGVARRAWSSNPSDATKSMETMTASGGTPAYMAPEVLLQQHDDGRSDIFSLGLVFYEMLGGDQPFAARVWPLPSRRSFTSIPPRSRMLPRPWPPLSPGRWPRIRSFVMPTPERCATICAGLNRAASPARSFRAGRFPSLPRPGGCGACFPNSRNPLRLGADAKVERRIRCPLRHCVFRQPGPAGTKNSRRSSLRHRFR